MSAASQIFDWAEASYDIAFRDSTRVEWFALRDPDASAADTDRRVLDGARRLAALWTPEPWTVTVGTFTSGIPDGEHTERLELRALEELSARDEGHALVEIGPTPSGALRIAVPDGARIDDEWILADDDGRTPLPYELSPAEPVGDLRTLWLRVPDALASSDLSVFVERLDQVSARLTLGATVFRPERDPRPPRALILGALLADWHAVNAELLRRVSASMRDAGWARGRDS